MALHKNSKLAFKRTSILGSLYFTSQLSKRNLNDVLSVSEIIKIDKICELIDDLTKNWDKHYIKKRYTKEKK